jgi:hypothetical protein
VIIFFCASRLRFDRLKAKCDEFSQDRSYLHRQGLGGSDEGLTFDITTVGPEDEGYREAKELASREEKEN